MRQSCFIGGLAGLLTMGLSVGALEGQIVSTGASSSSLTMRQGIVIDRPYTAVVKISTVVALADGTRVLTERTDSVARDSSGRTYRANRPSTMNPPCTDNHCGDRVMIHDPVKHTKAVFDANDKVATIEPETKHEPMYSAQAAASPATPAKPEPPTSADPSKPTWTVEDLGWKTIHGLSCQGTKRIWVYPAGFFGNDRPITSWHEVWISPEIMAEVLEIDSDPRSGVTTFEMDDIERAEPDPALFQPPDGYTVMERNSAPRN
jgi:hypothetical protein